MSKWANPRWSSTWPPKSIDGHIFWSMANDLMKVAKWLQGRDVARRPFDGCKWLCHNNVNKLLSKLMWQNCCSLRKVRCFPKKEYSLICIFCHTCWPGLWLVDSERLLYYYMQESYIYGLQLSGVWQYFRHGLWWTVPWVVLLVCDFNDCREPIKTWEQCVITTPQAIQLRAD